MKRRYFILIALISYIFFTLTNIPANKILALLKSNIEIPARIYGVEGSLWQGSAQTIEIKSQPPLKNFYWSINPLALLWAQVSADIQTDIEQQTITGQASYSLISGMLTANNIHTELKAEALQKLINLPFGELSGNISGDIKQLAFDGQAIQQLEGVLRWHKAKFSLAETVSLGNIQILLSSDDANNIIATLNNKGGQLKLEGHVKLQPNNNYQLDMKFIPDKKASGNIKQSLSLFAKRQNNGSYRLKQNGNLRNL